MKKLIFPAILLALLSGCGEVNGTTDNKDINVVSETMNGTTTDLQSYETESTTDELSTSDVTTSKSAGNKVSGTTTAVHTTKNIIVSATRASGNDGVVHGTTRSVPTVHRTTTTTSQSTTATEPSTQTTSFDPKDYSNISFSLGTKPNEIKVIRKSKSGEESTIQQLKDVDTTEIEKELKENSEKTLEDFIIRADFDDDEFPDIFIIEKQDDLNQSGKYYRYDPEKGVYSAWKEMNELKNLVDLDDLNDGKISVLDRKGPIEYELRTYQWDASKLILKSTSHQYPVASDPDNPHIEYICYNEKGEEISREIRDISGKLIEEDPPVTTEPPTEPTEPTEPVTVNEEE